MASIRKRDGKWQARVVRKGYPALAKTFINKTDAITWARRVEVDMERGHLMALLRKHGCRP